MSKQNPLAGDPFIIEGSLDSLKSDLTDIIRCFPAVFVQGNLKLALLFHGSKLQPSWNLSYRRDDFKRLEGVWPSNWFLFRSLMQRRIVGHIFDSNLDLSSAKGTITNKRLVIDIPAPHGYTDTVHALQSVIEKYALTESECIILSKIDTA